MVGEKVVYVGVWKEMIGEVGDYEREGFESSYLIRGGWGGLWSR